MKRIVFALLACLISITSFAQVSISTDSPNVDVTVKRAFARGENVYLDLLITCHNRWEYVGVSGCTAYDDEGNYYDMWKPSRPLASLEWMFWTKMGNVFLILVDLRLSTLPVIFPEK